MSLADSWEDVYCNPAIWPPQTYRQREREVDAAVRPVLDVLGIRYGVNLDGMPLCGRAMTVSAIRQAWRGQRI